MKKFLIVLTLVLCMAFPAAAKTFTTDANTTPEQLRAAVKSADVDTIVVDGNIVLPAKEQGSDYCGLSIPDKTLTLQINEGHTITVTANKEDGTTCYDARGIQTTGDHTILTIKGKGSIVVSNDQSDTHKMFGVHVGGGTVNIDGGVHISAISNNNKVAYGVAAFYAVTVNIDGGASISASSDKEADGVYMYGSSAEYSPTVNILSADINATGACSKDSFVFLGEHSTLTVYAGTFFDDTAKGYLGPDSAGVSDDKYVVTNEAKLTFTPTSLDVAQGSSGVVSADFRDSDNAPLSIDTVEAFPAVPGITVTSSDGAIQFNVADTCEVGTYTFNVICSAENSGNANSKPHKQTGEITVNVTEKSDPEPTPSYDVSNGSCNAGFAGLALAAFALLAAKRKK